MEQGSNSRSILIVGIILLFFGFSAYMIERKPQMPHQPLIISNYEMIRPEETITRFNLSDREVDRKVIESPKPTTVSANPIVVPGGKPPAAVVDPKAKALAAKKNAAKQQGKAQARKGKYLSIDIIEANKSKMSQSETDDYDQTPAPTTNYGYYAAPFEPPKEKTNEDKNADLKLSLAEWKKLILEQPTGETASRFARAHSEGLLSDDSFYNLTFEAYRAQAPEHKQWALSVLLKDDSVRAFDALASEYAKVPEELRAELWKIMILYRSPSKFAALSRSLANKNRVTVDLALKVVGLAVEDQKTWLNQHAQSGQIETQQQDPQNSRLPGRYIAGQNPGPSFRVFMASLTQWSQANDPSVSPVAQTLLSEIEKFVKPLDKPA